MGGVLGRRVVGVLAVIVCLGAVGLRAQEPARAVTERGPAGAPVTVVEFCSYTSEACSRLNIVVSGVIDEFGDRVRLVFRHADDSAAGLLRYRAALAAGRQEQFWPMHDLLMANHRRAARADILAMARQLGLDAERFRADLDSAETISTATPDQNEVAARNIATAPALLVNGRSLAAVPDASGLRAAIHLALSVR